MFQIVLESDYSSENYKANDALKFTSKFDVGRFVVSFFVAQINFDVRLIATIFSSFETSI